MKNTVLHTKTTFSKSLNWILYIKNYEIQRKRCLSATYNNLYHYAGNNPVCYTDPTGKFEVDWETQNVYVNLDSKKDIKRAEHFYKYNQNFTLTAQSKNGDTINFSSYKDYKSFNSVINGKKIEIGDLCSMLSNTTYVISEAGKTVEEFKNISQGLGTLSDILGGITTISDLYKTAKDPSFSNIFEVIIDGTGFIPVYGQYISTALSEGKWFAETMGAMTYYCNIYLQDNLEDKMFESYGF